jgi:hypothetical protein
MISVARFITSPRGRKFISGIKEKPMALVRLGVGVAVELDRVYAIQAVHFPHSAAIQELRIYMDTEDPAAAPTLRLSHQSINANTVWHALKNGLAAHLVFHGNWAIDVKHVSSIVCSPARAGHPAECIVTVTVGQWPPLALRVEREVADGLLHACAVADAGVNNETEPGPASLAHK